MPQFPTRALARLVATVVCFLTVAAQAQVVPSTGPSVATGPVGENYPGNSAATAKKYTLSGTVVNSQTGEGIPHAMVQVNQLATMTDANGSFSLEGLPQGAYFVMAQKPGFFSSAAPNRPPGVTAMLGGDAQPVSLSLAPEAVIYGHVTDGDGLPVARLNVQVMRSIVNEGRRDWLPMGTKQTDEDGYYRVAGLQPGTYLVVAGPSQLPSIGAMAKTGKQNSGYGVAYFPAPADNGAAAGMQVAAGQKVSADLSVDAEPFYSITGTLNAPAGTGVWFNMTPRNNLHTDRGQAVMRGDNNTFDIRMIPRGDYILHAGTQVQGKQWDASVPLHVAGDITGLPIVLAPSASIPIVTHVERTQPTDAQSQDGQAQPPQPQMGAFNRFQGPPLQVNLRSVDNPQQQIYAMYRPPRQGGGAEMFSLENIPPGTYQVEFHPNNDLYVSSARYGSTDLLRENLVIGNYAGGDPIDITLRDDGGKVKVTLTSDGQKANGNLLVVPDHGSAFPAQNLSFTGQGEIVLQSLRPGSYSILAFEDLSDVEYHNSDALAPYLSKAGHVDLTANQQESVAIELIKRGAQ